MIIEVFSLFSRNRESGIDTLKAIARSVTAELVYIQFNCVAKLQSVSWAVLILKLCHLSHLQRKLSVGKVNSEEFIQV